MRFIYITCNVSMQEQMESLLRELEISVYQVIPKALAESNFDIPHKDTAVWPGFNTCLLVQEADVAKSTYPRDECSGIQQQRAHRCIPLVYRLPHSTRTHHTRAGA